MENIDPKLQPNNKKFREMLSSIFDDPKFVKINDPNIKNYYGFRQYAEYFNKLDRFNDLKYKAHGIFSFNDVFAANSFRFLINWLEAFNFKFGSANSASLAVSRGFLRNGLAGSINTASFLTWNSLAAQYTNQKQVSPFTFWLTAQGLQLAFAPVTALATQIYLNGTIS